MKRFLALLLCMLMAFGGATIATAEEEPYHFVWFMADQTEDCKNDRVYQYLCEKFNISFDIVAPSWNEQAASLRMLITGGDMPDLMNSPIVPGEAEFATLIEEEMFLDLTDYLASGDYPNLAAYVESDPTFSQYKLDGRWYGIPRYFNGIMPHMLQYRQDWLDELGLAAPTTMDELYEVLKAVVAADPEGTGTIGLAADGKGWINHFTPAFTGAYGWTYVDGRYVAHYAMDEYKDFIAFFAKLYAEGLLDPDFVLGTPGGAQEKFIAGRAFMINYNVDSPIFATTVSGVTANYPEAIVAISEPMEGPAGKYVMAGQSNVLGINTISSECENPERLLALLDYIASEEGVMLTTHGIEGVHYTLGEDGEIIRNEDEYAADAEVFPAWSGGLHNAAGFLHYKYTDIIPANDPNHDMLAKGMEIRLSNTPIASVYTYQFTSDNYVDYNADVSSLVDEWVIAFITGTKDLDTEWDAYKEALNDAGYSLIEDDLNAWMAEHAG